MKPLQALAAVALISTTGCLFAMPMVDWYDRGVTAYHRNSLDDAADDFSKVAASDARYQHAQYYLGAILAKRDQLDPALLQMQKARDLGHEKFDEDSEMVRGLATVYGVKVKRWEMKEDDVVTQIRPADDLIITVGHHGVLSALDAQSQSVVWEKPVGVRGSSGEARPQTDESQVYVTGSEKGNMKEKLWALDRKTGKERWSVELGAKYDFTNAAVDRDYVYAGSGKSQRGACTLNAYRKSDGKLAFSMPVDGLPGTIVAGSDAVCVQTSSNKIYCAKPGDHFASPWLYEATGSIEHNTLAIGGGLLYASIGGDLYALHIGGATPLAFKVTGKGPLSSPVVAGGTVFVQTVEALKAYDAVTGQGLWIATNPGRLHTLGDALRGRAPQISGDLVVGWTNELVFALPRAGGEVAWMMAMGPTAGQLASNPAVEASDVLVAMPKSLLALSPKPWGNPTPAPATDAVKTASRR